MFRISNRIRRWAGVLALSGAAVGAGGCAPSLQEEVQMGRQYAAEINRQLPIVEDAAVHRYINQLGNQIAQRADQRGLQYTFYVVNSDVVNAFAVPGGFIYINRGLIDRAENVSELAGVLGHEIGHVVARHGVDQMVRMQRAELGVNLAYVLLGRAPSGVEQAGLQLGAGAFFARHSREAEHEADELAIQYVTRAGINPLGVVTFFQKLMQDQQRAPSRVEQWFATHPLTQERVEATRRSVEAIPAAQRQNLTTNTQAFQQFQARVRQLPAARRSGE
ncbi:MAG TPA: M48 family metallopeptidase [Longimicrobiaceae bacterium]|nr:M48 family metallopeptidase [Longimicrobiaceae bacterium]